MPSSELPQVVRAFAAAHLTSLEEIEVLVALVDFVDRWWDANMLAHELGIPPARARSILDRLASQNLLDIRVRGEVRYQFRPAAPDLKDAALAFIEAYRRNPVAVIGAVLGQTKGRDARDFANAFRIRHDDRR